MTQRLFTPDEVDALIPQLAEVVGRAMEHHGQATALGRHLHEERERIQASGGGVIDQRDWRAKAERLDGLAIEVREALAEITALGRTARVLQFDVADRDAASTALLADVEAHGCYYGIVCNAGIARDGAFPALTGDDWDAVIHTNLDAFYNVLQVVEGGDGNNFTEANEIAASQGYVAVLIFVPDGTATTGVTDGTLLHGVRYTGTGAETESIVMRSRSGTVRRIEASHRWGKLEQIAGERYS